MAIASSKSYLQYLFISPFKFVKKWIDIDYNEQYMDKQWNQVSKEFSIFY